MGTFSPIRNIIDKALLLDLGNPNGSISEKESMLKEAAITLGCMDYYRTFPMRVIYMTTYNSSSGGNAIDWAGVTPIQKSEDGMYIPFENFFKLGEPRVPAEQLEHAHLLGIMRIERPAWGNWANPGKWSTQMFGFPMTGQGTDFNLLREIYSNTLDEVSTGQPFCDIDRMNNRVLVRTPWGIGQISIYAAIGFDSPEYVEMSKVDFLCKFISYRFIESIIQARDGIKFEADFSISTDALQRRLEKLKEEVDSIKNLSVVHMAQWA